MNKFEIVSKYMSSQEVCAVRLPVRATTNSAGYDFAVAKDTVVPSIWNLMDEADGFFAHKIPYGLNDLKTLTKNLGLRPTLVPTGVKCQLDPDKYLELSVRSSTPLNYWMILANGIGIIDSDYYNNPDNEGEIFFQFINFSPVDIILRAGDVIGQGIIKTYGLVDDDNAYGSRTGGFGSTSN